MTVTRIYLRSKYVVPTQEKYGGGFGCRVCTYCSGGFVLMHYYQLVGHTYRTAIRLCLLGAMLQHTTRRACAASLKHTNRFRWSALSLVQASHRLRSTEPAVASNLSVWANVGPSLAIDRRGTIEDAEAITHAADDGDTPVFLTTTRLGREVSRIVQSSQDVLHPEIVDLMVKSVDRRSSDAFDTFALIAKAHGKIGRPHLTLHLCEAVQRRTGQPLVPSTPRGLVLLLEAMQDKVLRHVDKAANSVADKERAVQDVLRRYEKEGKVVPLEGYMAAVKALNASGLCPAAIQVAQDARSKLGESTKGMDELYSLVMRQCSEQRDPDAMLKVLKEREDAGGLLTPDARLYAATMGCLGKAGRVSDALELLKHMVDRGEKPDEIAVNNVLAACARDASTYWEHAKSLFEGMETLWGVTPNVYHYTSLVTCLLKAGQWSDGIAMTDKMEADGITPNVRFLDHMMQASVGARQWVTAEAIFRAMTEKYGHPAVVSKQSTLHFIQSMVMQKKLRKVISYVSRIQYIKLEGKGPKVTLDVHLLKCFRTIPGVGSDALAGVLMTMANQGVKLHADSYSVVIAKANQDGNKKLSENLYNMLVMGRGAPSLSAANAAIKGCTDIDSALDIVYSLSEHKLVPDKFTYAALLHCCSKAQGDERVGDKATQVWEAMLQDGIVPHGGMLACYLQSLMRAGRWKTAAEVRERYRGGEELSRAEKHVDKFDYVAREDAVVDGVMANGLIDNGHHRLALEYVLEVLESRAKENSSLETPGQEYYVDEDNHTVLAGIRACREAGSCETAMGLLETCEARWAKGPLVRDGQAKGREWLEMTIRTRESRRRLYDCLLSLMEEKGAEWSDIRGVVERGMRNGAISLMKDEQGGNTAEQAIEFHGWSPASARCVLRCIIEDISQTDSDFLLSNGQYDLGRVVAAQGVREFGEVSERWHNDSPDPRGRRREFADGVKPVRFEEREYGKGRRWRRREKVECGDGEMAFWWKGGVRLSMIVGKPRQPPSIRHSLETFCTLGVQPPLRIRQDAANPGLLNIEPEDVRAWLKQGGTILGP